MTQIKYQVRFLEKITSYLSNCMYGESSTYVSIQIIMLMVVVEVYYFLVFKFVGGIQ